MGVDTPYRYHMRALRAREHTPASRNKPIFQFALQDERGHHHKTDGQEHVELGEAGIDHGFLLYRHRRCWRGGKNLSLSRHLQEECQKSSQERPGGP